LSRRAEALADVAVALALVVLQMAQDLQLLPHQSAVLPRAPELQSQTLGLLPQQRQLLQEEKARSS